MVVRGSACESVRGRARQPAVGEGTAYGKSAGKKLGTGGAQMGNVHLNSRILTAGRDHALLLTCGECDVVAVKSGFASGYLGSGSRSLSYVLRLLEVHGATIEEYEVAPEVLERLDRSALTRSDLAVLD